jgi:predicted MFS family arabinose efflux permease
MTTRTAAPRFPFFRLLVITGAIFAAVTSEFLPTGLLPDMASELRVSESQIGLSSRSSRRRSCSPRHRSQP